jgi:hypothetical protein
MITLGLLLATPRQVRNGSTVTPPAASKIVDRLPVAAGHRTA